MESKILEYQQALGFNRQAFLLNFREEFIAFEETLYRLEKVQGVVSEYRNARGRTHISHLPYLMIISRQFLNSFDQFWTGRSYDGWVLLRPAVEAALIMGKWIDDPKKNGEIWKNRERDRQAYKKTYEGKALICRSLPQSAEIQGVLSKINNDFMHGNSRYYYRHARLLDRDSPRVELRIWYNDEDWELKVNLYAFVHLSRFLLQSVARMFAAQFGVLPELDADLETLENHFKERVVKAAREYPEGKTVLTELGLWPSSLFSETA